MNYMDNKKHIILTARGLNCSLGRSVINRALIECIGSDFKQFFADKTILLCTIKEYGINELLKNEAHRLGFRKENIEICDEDYCNVKNTTWDCVYISEGNTFQLANMLKQTHVFTPICNSIRNGGIYIGASAGAMLACSSFEFAADFDRNFTALKGNELNGLDLLPNALGKTALIPHYTKAEFKRWLKNTSPDLLNKYDFIDYIANSQYRLF